MGAIYSEHLKAISESDADNLPSSPTKNTMEAPFNTAVAHQINCRKINDEFNKLYGNSRNTLHSATETGSRRMPQTIDNILEKNSKSLSDCFKRIDVYDKDIKTLVTERLVSSSKYQYTIPNTDTESIDNYINTRNNPQYETPPQSSSHMKGNEMRPNSTNTEAGADVM